jgi:uncharacterized protein YprB with RNaseH-like and TPR domain
MIPKLSGNKFLFENWNSAFCINFYDFEQNKQFIKDNIIGWCPASKVFARPRSDEEFIAIMLKDNTWCHLPTWAITKNVDDVIFFDFEKLGFDNDD